MMNRSGENDARYIEMTVEAGNGVEELTDFLASLGVTELMIEDGGEFAEVLADSDKYWDSELDESLLSRSRATFYLPDDEDGRLRAAVLEAALTEVGRTLPRRGVHSGDWENGWREYYQPMEIGRRLVVVPEWLEAPEDGRIPLRLDPGLIFGTGSHPTTRMCLEALEDIAPGAKKVLDLGCGSAILAIASLLLGAKKAAGVDVDPLAPDVARANAALNGLGPDRFEAFCGDAADFKGGNYDLVLANIVADVILSILPSVPEMLAPGGRFVCSGIIEGREAEIVRAAEANGLAVLCHLTEDGWYCYIMSTKSEVKSWN